MGDRFAANAPATGGNVVTTTETVAATSPPVTSARPGQPVTLDANVTINSGTGTTGVNLICRRGTTTAGTQVGDTVTITATAGTRQTLSATWQDTPGDVASQQYVVTVTQTGATANGTISHATLETHIDT